MQRFGLLTLTAVPLVPESKRRTAYHGEAFFGHEDGARLSRSWNHFGRRPSSQRVTREISSPLGGFRRQQGPGEEAG